MSRINMKAVILPEKWLYDHSTEIYGNYRENCKQHFCVEMDAKFWQKYIGNLW